MARRLVRDGDTVEWFSASFPGAPPEEVIDGIRIVRAGRQWTVHWSAFRRYRRRIARDFDIAIDEVNTIPFLTPLWANIPVTMLIHQLAREVWWYEAVFPLSAVGYVLEPLYLRPYQRTPVLTVSASTRNDLVGLGFKNTITVLPQGIEPVAPQSVARPSEPSFLYVGRLAPSKRIDHILHAFARFRQATGTGTLSLIGVGSNPHEQSLRRLTRRLRIDENVTFWGTLGSPDKHRLMATAHVLLMTSAREGWGLVVTEANACGTPAIVYDVPGLRDSVRHEATGLIVPPDPRNMAAAMVRLTTDGDLYRRLADGARKWSTEFSFDRTAAEAREAIHLLNRDEENVSMSSPLGG